MKIAVFRDSSDTGRRAAADAAEGIRRAIRQRGHANIIVATGASQFGVLAALVAAEGIECSIVVTDAISAARLGPGRYPLGSQSVEIGEDLIARSPDRSHFVGSTATMPRMAAVLRQAVGLSHDEVRRLTSENPRAVLQQTRCWR
jgi:N-acetylglucosamine-6-phosphate deacetylase